MSERVLKFWLQRFANDGDSEVLALQWRVWTENDPPAATRAVDWLLRRGLEDCRCAKPAVAVLEQLLRCEGLCVEVPRRCLAEFSDEDIADMALDNPKVDEFVADIRSVIAPTVGTKPDAARPHAAKLAEDGGARAAPGPSANGRVEPLAYSRSELLSARRASLGLKEESSDGRPHWTTAAAATVTPALARWEEQMSRREHLDSHGGGRKRTGAGAAAPSAGGEWRKESQRAHDARGAREMGGRREVLQVSETSWASQLRKRKEDGSAPDKDNADDADFLREMRSRLNKLTVEKFDHLSDQIIQSIARSTRPNRGVPTLMQLVFEKATTQHHFISMYVDLCLKLHTWFTVNEHVLAMELKNNFKRILLNQCQSSFEQYLEPPEGFEGLQGDEVYEAQVKYKTKMLGNIRLVGELIKHGMLEWKIALAVAKELASKEPAVREERLETLAVFLETVGPTLDDPSWAGHGDFVAVFGELERLVGGTEVSCRTRFLLRDTLDLRQNSWHAKKPRDLERMAPATLAEVHQKANANSWPEQPARPGRTDGLRRRAPGHGEAAASSFVGTSPASSSHPSPRSRAAASPQLRAAGSPQLRAAGSPQLRAAPSPHFRATGSPQLTPAPSPQLRAAGSPQPKAPPKMPPLPASAGGGGCLVTPAAGSAVSGGGAPAGANPASFQRELVQTLRQVGPGLDAATAARRLRACAQPAGYGLEEAADLLARIADEPRSRRQLLLPLLPALFASGVYTPGDGLGQAMEAFTRDAFIDPGGTDPPDLADIVLREMLPALGLDATTLTLPPCLCELLDCCEDDGG